MLIRFMPFMNRNKKHKKLIKDVNTLFQFINIYCEHNHTDRAKYPIKLSPKLQEYIDDSSLPFCDECKELAYYSIGKRIACKYDPKPACKKCPAHCYKEPHKANIREVMKFSGKHLIKSGKLHLIFKYW